MKLEKNKILITGASRGLGLCLVMELLKIKNIHLFLVARNMDNLIKLKNNLTNDDSVSATISLLKLDLITKKGLSTLEKLIVNEDIDHLIINAAITIINKEKDISLENGMELINLNIKASYLMINKFLHKNSQCKSKRSILLISSMASVYSIPYQSLYCGSKSFLSSFGRGVNKEMKSSNFFISVFHPQGFNSDMTSDSRLEGLNSYLLEPEKVAKYVISKWQSETKEFVMISKYAVINNLFEFCFFSCRRIIEYILDSKYRNSFEGNG